MRCLPSERRARPAGEWNHYRVECKDGRLTLAVKGKVVSGGSNCVPRKGFICLESEGSECHFRNVRIQELPPSGAPDQVDDGFRSLYTGVDLSGWKQDAGHKGHWIPKDWILEYDGKSEAPDHSLWSEREYGDFVLIVDCRSPQKGEMQHVPVTFGRMPMSLPTQPKNGQWNRFAFKKMADRLTVALNDKTVIENARLSGVPPRGPFALQHQDAPIHFANIYIKELSESKVTLVPARGIKGPFGTEIDDAGNIYFVEMTSDRLCKLDPTGTVTLLSTNLDGPHNLALAADGAIYIADTWKHRVQKFDTKTGKMTTIAGTGEKGFSGDGGPAKEAKFDGIHCVALAGNKLYLADLANRRIRRIDLQSGVVTTVAGNGQKGVPADGSMAIEASLVDPRAVIADEKGNIYILERSGHALRVVDPQGRIRTLAGTGEKGFSGDGGEAKLATFNGPKHLCFDLEGNILIADTENHVIRKYIGKDGTIARVAGSGKKGKAGLNGPPSEVELSQPHGVYVHRDGTLYIADSSNDRILKVDPN
jgi:sugar lactone lactonase YvrE